ncbi:hypothetical protein B4098_2419 [Heyndrickxia coagulans]|uniref:Uncharacterized protein n=1 Tax=Heyndrickxia coagulans TaxID=1398 RepID=A0A150JNF0_HEYCO|nr:hypothetical protein B4098_2419 [Heyndrickxia coagulans]
MIRGACLVYQDGRKGILQVQCPADFTGERRDPAKGPCLVNGTGSACE